MALLEMERPPALGGRLPHAATVVSPGPSPGASPVPEPCRSCRVRAQSICAVVPQAAMASVAGQRRFADGATILLEGDPADRLFNIVQGTVKIYRLLPDGRRQITGFLMPGDFLGLALATRNPYSAEAIGPVTLCRFDRRRFEHLVDDHPQLERRLLTDATAELSAAHEQMLLLGRKTAREKVASFLVTLHARVARRGGVPDRLSLPMSRTDIGDYLGLTIETVSRVFSLLRREGVLALHGASEVEILDRAALDAAAAG